MSWTIDYYETENGKFPVKDFIDGLNPKAKYKIIYAFDLLEEFGINVKPPKVEKLEGTPLWEIRIVGKDNIRIFYVTKSERSFLLLHGFVKKKQKTDKKEIKIAMERLEDYQRRIKVG